MRRPVQDRPSWVWYGVGLLDFDGNGGFGDAVGIEGLDGEIVGLVGRQAFHGELAGG